MAAIDLKSFTLSNGTVDFAGLAKAYAASKAGPDAYKAEAESHVDAAVSTMLDATGTDSVRVGMHMMADAIVKSWESAGLPAGASKASVREAVMGVLAAYPKAGKAGSNGKGPDGGIILTRERPGSAPASTPTPAPTAVVEAPKANGKARK